MFSNLVEITSPSLPIKLVEAAFATLLASESQSAENRIDALSDTCQGEEDETLVMRRSHTEASASPSSSPSAELENDDPRAAPRHHPMILSVLEMDGYLIKAEKGRVRVAGEAEGRYVHLQGVRKRRRCSTDSNYSEDDPKDDSEQSSEDDPDEDSEYHDDEKERSDEHQDSNAGRKTRLSRQRNQVDHDKDQSSDASESPDGDETPKAESSLKRSAAPGTTGSAKESNKGRGKGRGRGRRRGRGKRHLCTTCHKSFSRPSQLATHSHTHTGEVKKTEHVLSMKSGFFSTLQVISTNHPASLDSL